MQRLPAHETITTDDLLRWALDALGIAPMAAAEPCQTIDLPDAYLRLLAAA